MDPWAAAQTQQQAGLATSPQAQQQPVRSNGFHQQHYGRPLSGGSANGGGNGGGLTRFARAARADGGNGAAAAARRGGGPNGSTDTSWSPMDDGRSSLHTGPNGSGSSGDNGSGSGTGSPPSGNELGSNRSSEDKLGVEPAARRQAQHGSSGSSQENGGHQEAQVINAGGGGSISRSGGGGGKADRWPQHRDRPDDPAFVFSVDEAMRGDGTGRTTLMIRNIPNKFNQETFLDLMDRCAALRPPARVCLARWEWGGGS